ncbi:hypothetical protein LDENG_00190640 [Lucifuga dentata]|nr:hypothetical protein LDENG_00190640 [Lucifuga dentata]
MSRKWNFYEDMDPCYIWCKANAAFHNKIVITTVRHGGGSVMVGGCVAASGPAGLAINNGTMNSALYQKILKEKTSPPLNG